MLRRMRRACGNFSMGGMLCAVFDFVSLLAEFGVNVLDNLSFVVLMVQDEVFAYFVCLIGGFDAVYEHEVVVVAGCFSREKFCVRMEGLLGKGVSRVWLGTPHIGIEQRE